MKMRASSVREAFRLGRERRKRFWSESVAQTRVPISDKTRTFTVNEEQLYTPMISGTELRDEWELKLANLTEEQLQESVRDFVQKRTKTAISLFEDLSTNSSARIRTSVAAFLKEFDYLEVVNTLMRLLLDRSPEVREQATISLGRFGIPDTLPLMRRMSRDKSGRVRFATLRALRNFENSDSAEVLSVSSPLLLDPRPANAVTAYHVIRDLQSTPVVEEAQALIEGVERFHPTLAAASSESARAIMARFSAPSIDVCCDRNWRTIENRSEASPTQTSELTSVIDDATANAKRKGPRHFHGWWAGMLAAGQFTPGEPPFISTQSDYKYKFCAGISSSDLAVNYQISGPIPLGEGPTVVAVALVADERYLKIEGESVKEILVPAEGDSTVAEFLISGSGLGNTELEILVYHRGCLTLRAKTIPIEVRSVKGEVSSKSAVPATAPVMTKGDDLVAATSAVVQSRMASLLITPPLSNPGNDLLFALFYQDDSGYHFETARVRRDGIDVDRDLLHKNLNELIDQRKWGPFGKVFLQDTFDLNIKPKHAQASLLTLRNIGLGLWSDVFTRFAVLERIREQLRALLKTAGSESILQIVSDSVYLPWQLFYLGNDKDKPDPKQFWGMRFQTEQTLALGLDLKVSAPEKATEEIAAYVNNSLPEATLRRHLTVLSKSKVRDKETELLDDLKRIDNRAAALYLYCHAEYNSQNKQESWIQLTNDHARLTLMKLETQTRVDPLTDKQIQFQSAPLVFLNACKSGQMDSAMYESFVGFMLKEKKAGGVLGTETKMPAFFATALAVEFWQRARAKPAPVSKILFDLRTEYWNNFNNPLGFLYSLYSNGDFTVAVQ